MNELPPHAKQLLALARSADEPDEAARERVRRGVALAIGVGSAAAAGAASKAASASASVSAAAGAGAAKIGAGTSVAVKLALAGAVTVALGAGAWQLRPAQVAHERVVSQPVAHAPSSAAQKRAPAEQPVEQLAAPATPPVQEPPATPDVDRAQGAPPAEQRMRAPAEPRRARDTEAAKLPNALHAEMTLLQAASTALDHGDLARARELLNAHRQAHAAGQLRVERRGLEVLLHCIAREAGAGAAARAYLRAEPDGVLSARIAAACKAEAQR